MKDVYFSHPKGELIYQIFSLACSAYTAIQTGKKVLVVDSDLFNLPFLSDSLEKKGLRVIEKNNLEYKKLAVFYGQGKNVFDLTSDMPPVLEAKHDINLFKGDPIPNKKKELFIGYSLNGIEYTETHPEIRQTTIITDMDHVTYKSDFFWLDKVNITIYNDILKNIHVKGEITKDKDKDTHVIHLLSKDDIEQCAIQLKKPSHEVYELFTKKYIEIMTLFITNTTDTILIVQKDENPKIDVFLSQKGNPYKSLNSTDPATFLEVTGAAGIFVGLFNIDKLVGSSCSYYLHTIVPYSKSILLDLENIYEN